MVTSRPRSLRPRSRRPRSVVLALLLIGAAPTAAARSLVLTAIPLQTPTGLPVASPGLPAQPSTITQPSAITQSRLIAQTAPTSPSDPNQSFSARLLNLFPSDYAGRFGSLQAFADTTTGYGVRGFPLPFKIDARLTYIAHPKYQEYGVSARYLDTTYAAGSYQNDAAGATRGLTHLEANHNPYVGWQYGGVYQEGGLSKLSGGYAAVDGPVRLYTEAGYAFQDTTNSPFLHTEVSGGRSVTDGPYTVGAYATGRSYVFPQAAQFSVDLSASVTLRPTDYSSFTLSQFERFAIGESAIPALAVGRYTQTNLDAVLTPNARAGIFSMRSVEYHYQRSFLAATDAVNGVSLTVRTDVAPAVVFDLTPHHDFVAGETGLRADLYYRSDLLPVLIGPSVDYIWSPKSNRWSISLKAGVK